MLNVLEIARSQKGIGERADGSSKYGAWLDDQPPKTSVYAEADWCGAFQLWVIAQGGALWTAAAGGLNKHFAEVQVWFDWMRTHDRISSQPKARRLVWYDWAGTPKGANHIGMVDHFKASAIWAWEGNHDDEVRLVKRSRDRQIMGYGEWWDHIAADELRAG